MKRRKHNNRLKRIISLTVIGVILGAIPIYITSLKILNNGKKPVAVSIQNNDELDKAIDTSSELYSNSIVSKDILVVNKEISVDAEYVPDTLVVPNVSANKEIKVTKEVAESLEELFESAEKDGINLIAVSGYRTYNYQKSLFDNSVKVNGLEHAKKYVALPGYSEHHTGLAVDVVSDNYTMLDEGFENTAAFRWLEKNMSNFGFILRYPKGKEDITGYNYEPWHLRYVGKYLAEDIETAGVTLEEYISEN